MTSIRLAALVAAAAAPLAMSASAQVVLYEQPAPSPLTSSHSIANINSTVNSQRIADNFPLLDDAVVTAVEWWGTSINNSTGAALADANLSAFRVQIFAADGFSEGDGISAPAAIPGFPGTLLAEEDIAVADIVMTPGDPAPVTGGFTGGPTLYFSAPLSNPVQLSGGDTYWVAINAILVNPSSQVINIWWKHPFDNATGDSIFADDGFRTPVGGAWRRATGAEPAFRIIGTVGGVTDSDGDGLSDDDETLIHGTDPNNADTDGDGLQDGTEVDLAGNGSCHDPLNPDSDGDTLLDGVEAMSGTNPCSVDTDGDGVIDPIDQNPLDSNSTNDLENAIRSVADDVDSLDLGSFVAPNGNAATGRRNSLSSRIHSAANRAADGDNASAIDLLLGVRARLDGDPDPFDWIDDSEPQKAALRLYIDSLIDALL